LLAEAGCEAAAENAAWMLLHGQGAGGPQALDLAAHLLYRCVGWRWGWGVLKLWGRTDWVGLLSRLA
jgi:hypothetical protein